MAHGWLTSSGRKMGLKKALKGILGTVAPILGTAITGPFGAIANSILGNVFGDEDALEAALASGDPADIAKLKLAELEFKKFMDENGLKREDIAAKDRDSARKLAAAKGMWPQIVLSGLYTVGYFAILGLFVTGGISIPPESMAIASTLFGVLTASQVQIMNFWFGSSAGSAKKTNMLNGEK